MRLEYICPRCGKKQERLVRGEEVEVEIESQFSCPSCDIPLLLKYAFSPLRVIDIGEFQMEIPSIGYRKT